MRSLTDVLKRHDVRVVVITFTPPGLVRKFLDETPMPFPVLSDPERDAYRFFNMRRASILSFFKPRVLLGYLRRFLSGVKPRKPVDRDMLQLGGDILLDANGDVVWRWISQDATDRPSPEDLRAALALL